MGMDKRTIGKIYCVEHWPLFDVLTKPNLLNHTELRRLLNASDSGDMIVIDRDAVDEHIMQDAMPSGTPG